MTADSRCLAVAIVAVLAGCSRSAPDLPPAPASVFFPVPLGDRPSLHNVYRITDKLYSGSGPEGDAGFGSLRDFGVTTVASVDGARPDVEAARRRGLRYFHL